VIGDFVFMNRSGGTLIFPRAETACVFFICRDIGLPGRVRTPAEAGYGKGRQHQQHQKRDMSYQD